MYIILDFQLKSILFSNQCEQPNTSDYWDSFHTSVKLRETMLTISKRLTTTQSLVLVDTHCHFDLIFDRYISLEFSKIY